jgi:hypothetical protein
MTMNDTTDGSVIGSGNSTPEPVDAAPTPLMPNRPRRGPALIVLAVVAFITVGGIALAAISSPPKPSGKALGTLHGSSIPAVSAAKVVARVAVSGNPPTDVATSIVLPDTSSVTSIVRTPANLELFSGSINLNVEYASSDVTQFYRLELAHRGWKVLRTDASADGKGTTTFATFPSADGFYWELEVAVSSTSSAISPELGGGTATVGSKVSLQLVELNDQD